MEKTLLIIKPDAVRKRVIGKIISMVEEAGFRILGIRMKKFSVEEAREFYKVHKGKPFYDGLVEFMTSGPVVALLLERKDAIEELRKLIGATDPKEAERGTVRALFGSNKRENAVHASDSPSTAEYEIPFFFEE